MNSLYFIFSVVDFGGVIEEFDTYDFSNGISKFKDTVGKYFCICLSMRCLVVCVSTNHHEKR